MRNVGRRVRAGLAAVGTVLSAGCASGAGAPDPAAVEGCTVDVIVQFAPYVAAPGSQAFAAELVQGSGYHLRYVRSLGTSHVLRLTGRDATCDAGLAILKREPRIKSLEIDERQFRHTVRSPEAR